MAKAQSSSIVNHRFRDTGDNALRPFSESG
jgi:hypothetical protein